MNNQEQQDDFLLEHDFIRQHIMFKPTHIEYLKTLDPDNLSKANRMALDTLMRYNRISKMKDYLLVTMTFLILVLGVCQIILW